MTTKDTAKPNAKGEKEPEKFREREIVQFNVVV